MYDTLPIAQAPGLTMLVYTAEPGTPTADASGAGQLGGNAGRDRIAREGRRA